MGKIWENAGKTEGLTGLLMTVYISDVKLTKQKQAHFSHF